MGFRTLEIPITSVSTSVQRTLEYAHINGHSKRPYVGRFRMPRGSTRDQLISLPPSTILDGMRRITTVKSEGMPARVTEVHQKRFPIGGYEDVVLLKRFSLLVEVCNNRFSRSDSPTSCKNERCCASGGVQVPSRCPMSVMQMIS